jgi:hypothetical protein
MGNRRLYKIEFIAAFGTPNSEQLKVTALNLWEASRYPLTGRFPASRPKSLTTSPPFWKIGFSYYDTVSEKKGDSHV